MCQGDFIFSLAEDCEFVVFDRKAGSVLKKHNFETAFSGFMHPSTYLNKMVFWGQERLELWNVMEMTKVFAFSAESSPSCVEQSPVTDVVAVGFEDGSI